MNEVRVRVPASTANLGPGFDCLGIALRLYNTTTVRRGRGPAKGEMAGEAAALFFRESGIRRFAFHWEVEGSVPRSRGLGSSVTVRLGVLHGLNELAGRPLGRADIFRLCAMLEGHPDNAAPAAFGGFTISPPVGRLQRYKIGNGLRFALLIPGFEISTPSARRVLPGRIPLKDAVFSAGCAAAISAAFATGSYQDLAGCLDDRLHQPYREPLIPFLQPVIHAARKAGGLGGWLSGSGSTIACATLKNPEKIAGAMLAASDLDSAVAVVVGADNSGVRILP
ncbi:MAG: homoserine kinase [Terrimicrobiaceae bacterium]